MSDAQRARRLSSSQLDLLVAAGLACSAVVCLAASGLLEAALPDSVCVICFCGLVAWRARWPLAVALLAAALLAAPELSRQAQEINNSSAGIPALGALFLYAYALGAHSRLGTSLIGLIPLCLAANLNTDGFNPLVEMLTVGPWLGGLVVASRGRAESELALRARELEEERELFAAQSVRYERSRIARELHDIVAHCVSLMVVQANAGEYLAASDPAGAAEAFESISEAARQAEVEIGRLVELLGGPLPRAPSPGLRIVEELVRRAQASGLTISCQFIGESDDLGDESSDAAYRLVQESVTNAMKHAPGAPIEITVRGLADAVEVRVLNGPPLGPGSGLERLGGGHGLTGMRERVIRCGGVFSAEPTPDGGWCNSGRLPRHPPRLPPPRGSGGPGKTSTALRVESA